MTRSSDSPEHLAGAQAGLRELAQERAQLVQRYDETMTRLEQAVASAAEAGLSMTDIAEALDVSRPAVYKMLDAAGSSRTRRATPPRVLQSTESLALGRLTDEPITNPAADRLARTRLASVIAREVKRAPRAGGFTMAITGAWGSGKTSLVNLVLDKLDSSSGVEVVHFNPWFFSGTYDLLGRFFDEVAGQLEERPHRKLREAAQRLKAYRDILVPLVGALPPGGPLLAGALDAMAAAAEGAKSLHAQKQSVSAQLSKLDARLLVVIDDIDRLSPDEVREIVKLVRLVGDFPNVVYLLAFDASRVEAILGDDDPRMGREYLEKIVQLSYALPNVPKKMLRQIALEDLDAALRGRVLAHFDEHAWQNMFALALEPMLRHLRDVRRFANAAPAAIDLLGEEVAAQDLLALTALRVFEPQVHDRLATISELLLRDSDRAYGNFAEPDPRSEQLEELLRVAINRAAVSELLRLLFPQLGDLLGGSRVVGSARRWRRDRRVADDDVLRVYLSGTRDDDDLTTQQIERILNVLGDERALEDLLAEVPPHQLPTLLDRLRDYSDTFEANDALASARAFLALLDRLPREPQMFALPPEWALHFVVEALLEPVAEGPERDTIIERLFHSAGSLSQKMRILNWFGTFPDARERRKRGELLSAAVTQRLTSMLRSAVTAADAKQLAEERELLRLLVLITDEQGRRKLIQRWASETSFLLALLRASFSYSETMTHGDAVARRKPQLNWSILNELLGADELRQVLSEAQDTVSIEELDPEVGLAFELAQIYATGKEEPPVD